MGRAGIPVLGSCLMEGSAGRYRTRTDLAAAVRGGGATRYEHDQVAHPTAAARATWPDTRALAGMGETQMLENVEGFLKVVLPVAEEAGAGLALHPDDPQGHERGLRGRPPSIPHPPAGDSGVMDGSSASRLVMRPGAGARRCKPPARRCTRFLRHCLRDRQNRPSVGCRHG